MGSSLDWKTNITPGALWIRSTLGILDWDREMESEREKEVKKKKKKWRVEGRGEGGGERRALQGTNA